MMYEFALVLDHEPNDDEVDALFEAGLDDAAGIEAGNGSAIAHIGREASSFADAVVSAVHQIESAGLTATAVESEDLVTLKDIAARVGRTYESVRRLATGTRGPGGFPPPMSASGWSLYSWSQVADWFHQANLAQVEADAFDRRIAVANYLVRARALLHNHGDDQDLHQLVTSP